jgi:hypothetical protein
LSSYTGATVKFNSEKSIKFPAHLKTASNQARIAKNVTNIAAIFVAKEIAFEAPFAEASKSHNQIYISCSRVYF